MCNDRARIGRTRAMTSVDCDRVIIDTSVITQTLMEAELHNLRRIERVAAAYRLRSAARYLPGRSRTFSSLGVCGQVGEAEDAL